MTNYLMKMKAICDTLAACGRPISEEDQVLSIFVVLGPEFEPTIVVLTSRSDSYNVKAAIAVLLASESIGLEQSNLPESPMTANLVMHSTKTRHTHNQNSSPNRGGKKGPYGQHNFGGCNRIEDKATTTNLFVNFVERMAMLFRSVIIVVISHLMKSFLHHMIQEKLQEVLVFLLISPLLVTCKLWWLPNLNLLMTTIGFQISKQLYM